MGAPTPDFGEKTWYLARNWTKGVGRFVVKHDPRVGLIFRRFFLRTARMIIRLSRKGANLFYSCKTVDANIFDNFVLIVKNSFEYLNILFLSSLFELGDIRLSIC